MCEAECINCPDSDEQYREGDLANPEDTEEEDGEKGSDDWHESVEAYPVKQSSSHSTGQAIHYSVNT